MKLKFYHGQQYIYLFALIIILGFAGWYYMQASFFSIQRIPDKIIARLPDIIVNNLRVTQFSTEGKPTHYFYTPQLIHFPHQNLSQFIKPHITLASQKGNPWIIHADKGESESGLDKVTLLDHVVIHQDPSASDPNEKEKTITTSEITYYPKKNFAETQKMIFFEEPGLHVQSLGMTAELEKQKIHLLQQVSSVYVQDNQKNQNEIQ